jgi:hypothetical protein
VLLPAPRAVVSTHVAKDVRYVVVPGSALRSHPGQQRLHIEGDGPVFAAYGRTSDVTAWLSGERYQRIGIAGAATTASAVLATARVLPALEAAEPHPDPDGADLWLDQQRASGTLDWTVNLPDSMSLLIAADGASPAPSVVTVSWPVRVATPFATPLIVGGSVLVVVGLLLYMWALVHLKRRRGPRRKSPPPPPAAPRYRQSRTPETAGTGTAGLVRRFTAVGGATVAGAVLLAGCSSAPAPAAQRTAPVQAAVAAPSAAITAAQAQRIVRDVAAVAAAADAKGTATLLTPRFTGPALVLRHAAYVARKRDKHLALPQAIPADTASIGLTLPEATSGWPRTLFAVVTDTAKPAAAPLALTLVQDDPRSPYRAQYVTALGKDLPVLASSLTGAKRLHEDTDLLRVRPAELAADYGKLLRRPTTALSALFDTEHDSLLQSVGAVAKQRIAKKLGRTARIGFVSGTASAGPVIAMATADGGAIVAVNLKEQWTVKPVKAGVTVKPSGATKALAKVSATGKGIVSTYGYQLLFSVPSAGSKDRVELLGYAQGLTSAKEL